MIFKEELRKVFKFLQTKAVGGDEYANNAHVTLSGKKYFVGKMSYDEWYIEPYYVGRTETDKFSSKCLWEKSDTAVIVQMFIDNNLMECKAK